MSTIVTRADKGSPLTHTEVDNNFTNLNTDKLQSGSTASSLAITSADINGGTIDGTAIGSSSASTGAFTSLSDSGNLTFTGTGNRITGDFSNATINNRVLFQSSTTNGVTSISIAPNGTSAISAVSAESDSSATNGSTAQLVMVGGSDSRLVSGIRGTGTYIPLTMYTGGSERLRIDTSGNVGIGTSSPGYRLDVAAADTTAGFGYGARIRANSTAGAGSIQFTDNPVSTQYGVITGSTTEFKLLADGRPMTFVTGGVERMRIDSSGNLLVGTTTSKGKITSVPKSTFNPLATNTSWANDAAVAVSGIFGGGVSWIDGSAGYCAWADSSGNNFNIAGGSIYGIVTNGVYLNGNSATSWSGRSDERLKDKLEPITDAINKVNSLRAVTGVYKNFPNDRQAFLLAQDVQAVLPEAVSVADVQSPEKYLGLSYTQVIPLLVAAIKEQQAIITDLKARIETLENK